MIKRFLILTLICAYQAFMQGSAESQKPRTSGLALMRLQPEFRPIITGSCDDSNILSKTILVEELQYIQGFHEIGQYDRTTLKRSFCHLFIHGSEQKYREATVAQLAPFQVNLDLRAKEIRRYYQPEDLKNAQEDTKEFPTFYEKPQILSPNGDEIITSQCSRYLTLSARFMRSLTDEDLREPRFSELSQIAIAMICVHPKDKESNNISWTVNDEKDTLTKTHESGEFHSPSSAVHFVMCTQEGRDFAKKFLAQVNIKEMQRRKNRAEDIYHEFLKEAAAEELKLCGVAIMPHINTERN